jgi:hypothetical protein
MTPQPTPATLSVPDLALDQTLPGPRSRIANLCRDCLIQDRHRCVSSRNFDENEMVLRTKTHGDNAADDDGVRFVDMREADVFELLQIAHILPHALMSTGGDNEQSDARRNALAILDMLGILPKAPTLTARPNAITLTANLRGS